MGLSFYLIIALEQYSIKTATSRQIFPVLSCFFFNIAFSSVPCWSALLNSGAIGETAVSRFIGQLSSIWVGCLWLNSNRCLGLNSSCRTVTNLLLMMMIIIDFLLFSTDHSSGRSTDPHAQVLSAATGNAMKPCWWRASCHVYWGFLSAPPQFLVGHAVATHVHNVGHQALHEGRVIQEGVICTPSPTVLCSVTAVPGSWAGNASLAIHSGCRCCDTGGPRKNTGLWISTRALLNAQHCHRLSNQGHASVQHRSPPASSGSLSSLSRHFCPAVLRFLSTQLCC